MGRGGREGRWGKRWGKKEGHQEGWEGGSEGGSPVCASPKGWKQCSSGGAGKLLCSVGSAGEKPARNWAWWAKERALERGKREVERKGRSRGQAKGFILGGTTEDQAFLGDGSQGERRLSGGSRGEGAKMLEAEMGLCWWRAGKDGGAGGKAAEACGEAWGRWRGSLGNQ